MIDEPLPYHPGELCNIVTASVTLTLASVSESMDDLINKALSVIASIDDPETMKVIKHKVRDDTKLNISESTGIK